VWSGLGVRGGGVVNGDGGRCGVVLGGFRVNWVMKGGFEAFLCGRGDCYTDTWTMKMTAWGKV